MDLGLRETGLESLFDHSLAGKILGFLDLPNVFRVVILSRNFNTFVSHALAATAAVTTAATDRVLANISGGNLEKKGLKTSTVGLPLFFLFGFSCSSSPLSYSCGCNSFGARALLLASRSLCSAHIALHS